MPYGVYICSAEEAKYLKKNLLLPIYREIEEVIQGFCQAYWYGS